MMKGKVLIGFGIVAVSFLAVWGILAGCIGTGVGNGVASFRQEGELRLKGHIVDVVDGRIFDGEIVASDGVIVSVEPCTDVTEGAPYIMPGFVDAHVHIESSMMLPPQFACMGLRHGTVGAVCDPHEIANVMGVKGVEMMLDSAADVPFHFGFGVPSCVPSCGSDIETSGYVLDSRAVARLLRRSEVCCLSEMMNYPGVLGCDSEVMAKISAARALGKPIDGHAPGLVGQERKAYAEAGISTDHECSMLEEAREALQAGMMIQIREGSAARNYAALAPLIAESPESLMFCTDDLHPTDFQVGHIDRMVRRAIGDGYDPMDVLRIACLNPVRHYGLPVGLLRKGDSADFICVSDISPKMRILDTYIAGVRCTDIVAKTCELDHEFNKFSAEPISEHDIAISHEFPMDVITATDGSLLTGHEMAYGIDDGMQKIVSYNRYEAGARPVVAYVRGFGIGRGAFAQTIAHDCHNIVAIGSCDSLIVEVVNRLIELNGGIVATDGEETVELQLPIGGIMSPLPGDELAEVNRRLEQVVARAGCPMHSPFITLGFMSLPVIPSLKLTDKGLFDSSRFRFVGK